MKILFKKIQFVFLSLFSLFLVESCQEQDTVQPAPTNQAEPSVVQRITNLGFDADEIKDMGSHYLVDGDIYFSKNNTDEEKFGNGPVRIDDGKYPVFTVRMDHLIAGNDRWKVAVDHAIAKWNEDKRQHLHFALTTSTTAHVTIRADNGELAEDVPVASEFAEHGRLGSTIRVNLKYTGSVTQEETEQKMLKALTRTTGYHQPKNTSSTTAMSAARSSAEFPVDDYLYIIRNDQLVRVKKTASIAYADVLSEGWQGSTHMVMGRDEYLYVIQGGVLFWADPQNGNWGYISEGWENIQSLEPCVLTDFLYIIDKKRDLYLVGNTGGRVKITDLGSSGTFRMVPLTGGIAISDPNTNQLKFYDFSKGKLTVMFNQVSVYGESERINWKNVVAMTRRYNNPWHDEHFLVLMKGSPKRLLICKPWNDFIRNWEEDIDWTAVKAVTYSMDNMAWEYLYYFQNGYLYKWSTYSGIAEKISGDPYYHNGNWEGAFLVACTDSDL